MLLFRELHATDEQQAAFARRLGTLAWFPNDPNPEVMEISFVRTIRTRSTSRATTTGTWTASWTRSRRRRR